MKRILITLIILLLFCPATGLAFEKTATTCAPFLKVGAGARALGLGGSFVAHSGDVSALYWNPAGIASISRPVMSGTHMEWIGGLSHDFVGFVTPLASGTIGISGIFLNTDKIEITTMYEQDGTGLYYDTSDMALGLTYSRFLTDRFAVGLTTRYIHQSLYDLSAQTVSFDIGTQLTTNFWGAVLGMSISNFGGKMALSGSKLIVATDIDPNFSGDRDVDARLKTEAWPLPLTFRVGLVMDVIGGTNLAVED